MESSSSHVKGKTNGKTKIIFDSDIDIVKFITEQKNQKIESDSVSDDTAPHPKRNNKQLYKNG